MGLLYASIIFSLLEVCLGLWAGSNRNLERWNSATMRKALNRLARAVCLYNDRQRLCKERVWSPAVLLAGFGPLRDPLFARLLPCSVINKTNLLVYSAREHCPKTGVISFSKWKKLQSVSPNLWLVISVVDIATGIMFPWRCPGGALIFNLIPEWRQNHRKTGQSMLVRSGICLFA